MEKLSRVWDRVERRAIYYVLFAVFVLELASMFSPTIRGFMDTSGTLALLAMALLLIFRHLDERLEGQRITTLTLTNGLLQGVIDALGKEVEHDDIVLFAHTGNVYFQAFKESKAKVNRLRILLRRMDVPDNMQFPRDEKAKNEIKHRQDTTVQEWKNLATVRGLKDLQIEYYEFEPMVHFVVMDDKRLLFGLYKLEADFPGVSSTAYDFFRADSDDNMGRLLIGNLRTFFEAAWLEAGQKTQNTPNSRQDC